MLRTTERYAVLARILVAMLHYFNDLGETAVGLETMHLSHLVLLGRFWNYRKR